MSSALLEANARGSVLRCWRRASLWLTDRRSHDFLISERTQPTPGRHLFRILPRNLTLAVAQGSSQPIGFRGPAGPAPNQVFRAAQLFSAWLEQINSRLESAKSGGKVFGHRAFGNAVLGLGALEKVDSTGQRVFWLWLGSSVGN